MKSLLGDGKPFHKFWKQSHLVNLLKLKLFPNVINRLLYNYTFLCSQ